MLVGRAAVMGLLLGLGKVPLELSLDQLLLLFQYPPRSSCALLAGTLPLRYCATRTARKVPFWTLPVPGHVAGLIAAEVQVAQVDEVQVARRDIHWISGCGPGRKRIRLTKKQHTSWDYICMLVHVFGRGCIVLGILIFRVLIAEEALRSA